MSSLRPSYNFEFCIKRPGRFDGLQDCDHIPRCRTNLLQSIDQLIDTRTFVQLDSTRSAVLRL
jgi:hypothetical protein